MIAAAAPMTAATRTAIDVELPGWARLPRLDEAFAEGQAGQVGAAAAAGLVPDAVQVRGDRAGADVQLGGDLGVGAALGDQGDEFPVPGR